MLVDTHCHLNFDSFEPDREAVIQGSLDAGIIRMLNPGVDLTSSRVAVALAEKHPAIFAAVGVHPNDAASWQDDTLAALEDLARSSKVVAVGEIGLDYYREISPPGEQRRIFETQLALAAKLDLPVIVHSRQALDDALDILETWVSGLSAQQAELARRPGVLHSYEGRLDQALRAIDLGFYIGVSGPVTFKNAPDRREVVSALPTGRLLTETDAPFLAPQPYRGRRNEPAYTRYIAETVASLHQLTYPAFAEIATANAAELFAWGVSD